MEWGGPTLAKDHWELPHTLSAMLAFFILGWGKGAGEKKATTNSHTKPKVAQHLAHGTLC